MDSQNLESIIFNLKDGLEEIEDMRSFETEHEHIIGYIRIDGERTVQLTVRANTDEGEWIAD